VQAIGDLMFSVVFTSRSSKCKILLSVNIEKEGIQLLFLQKKNYFFEFHLVIGG